MYHLLSSCDTYALFWSISCIYLIRWIHLHALQSSFIIYIVMYKCDVLCIHLFEELLQKQNIYKICGICTINHPLKCDPLHSLPLKMKPCINAVHVCVYCLNHTVSMREFANVRFFDELSLLVLCPCFRSFNGNFESRKWSRIRNETAEITILFQLRSAYSVFKSTS